MRQVHALAGEVWRDLLRAVVFLTRIPAPYPDGPAKPLADSLWIAAPVGAAIGAVGAAVFAVFHALALPPAVAATAAVAATVWLTGALHEDGLADCADGFGGGFTRARKIEIMRDSRVGTYGAAAMILSLTVRIAALASLATPAGVFLALVVAHAVSRSQTLGLLTLFSPAGHAGLGAEAGGPSLGRALVALLLGLVIAVLCVGLGAGLLAALLAWLAAIGVLMLAKHQLGGYTGDVLGTAQQAAEIAALLVVVAWLTD